jgi:hypothetical protein
MESAVHITLSPHSTTLSFVSFKSNSQKNRDASRSPVKWYKTILTGNEEIKLVKTGLADRKYVILSP